jgi:mono/diheme cytochrome c family protein
MKKILLAIVSLVVIVAIALAVYVKFALPSVGAAPKISFANSEARVQHGKYLAWHVTACMDCHSSRDWSKYSAPLVAGTEGKGGELFDEAAGFPGKIYSYNITPANLHDWTDGEIFRTITTGVDKFGKALFPVMPYLYYGKMDKEDIYDIIAYIRTLKPIESKTEERSLDFPMNFIVNTIPQKASFTQKPDKADTVKYGGYLVNAAGCIECHTPVKRGQIIPEFAFSGGREFKVPNGIARSANITPDVETGIGNWSSDAFVARFKSFADMANIPTIGSDKVNTIMPWTMYAGMDTSDLRSIFAYLKTLKPVSKNVTHFEIKK